MEGFHPILFYVLALPPCAYCLFLLVKGLVAGIRQTPHFWLRLALLLGAVAFLSLLVASVEYLVTDTSTTFEETHWLLAAGILACLGTGYLFRSPAIHPVKPPICCAVWSGGFIIFSTLLCLVTLPLVLMGRELILPLELQYAHACHRLFHLESRHGCLWFTFAGFVLVGVAYLLSGDLLARWQGTTLRRLFTRVIRLQWSVFAGIYAISLLCVAWQQAKYRQAVQKLEAHFGHSMNLAEYERRFYAGRTPDPEYWRKMETALRCFRGYGQRHEGDSPEADLVHYPTAVLPRELYEKRRKEFLDLVERSRVEELIVNPIPPPVQCYDDTHLFMGVLGDIDMVRTLSKIERRIGHYAIDSGDFAAAAQSMDRLDLICDFLCKDIRIPDGGTFIWIIRNELLERLVNSRLPPEDWLETQATRLQQWEERIQRREKAAVDHLFGMYHHYVVHLLPHALPGNKAAAAELDLLHDHSIRFFFPQAWWLALRDATAFADSARISRFGEWPFSQSVCFNAMRMTGHFFGVYRNRLIAATRILRGLITAELQRRRTGQIPDALHDLPLDPFSNQPLKYRKGPCQIQRFRYQGQKLVKETQTVNALQIWSIGADLENDDGRNGDIRFLLEIPADKP